MDHDDREEMSQAKCAQMLREMRENMPALLDMAVMTAKLYRHKYEALLKEGFTPEQALRLCTL